MATAAQPDALSLPRSSRLPVRGGPWAEAGTVLALLFLLALLLLAVRDRFDAEFNSHADEPAHYVTGLMVRDYVAAGFPTDPLTYARDYYLHYPKVALGQWPPAFYALQTAWTLVFPDTRASVLVLMALIAAALGTLLFAAVRPIAGLLTAAVIAATLVCLPLVQQSTGRVMADLPAAALMLAAALRFGTYLDTGMRRDAASFGLLCVAAILTRSGALALALLPPVALAASGRWRRLREPAFWLAPLLVLVVCGPWQMLTVHSTAGTFGAAMGWSYTVAAIGFWLWHLARALGPVLGVLVLLGLWTQLAGLRRARTMDARWASLLGLLVSVLAFHSIVSAGWEPRYILAAVPPLLAFAAAGFVTVSRVLARRWPRPAPILTGALLATLPLLPLVRLLSASRPPDTGMGLAGRAVAVERDSRYARVLVSSEGNGEGVLIAAVAMHESRPSHYVFRASKLLAGSDWNGRGYRARFTTAESLLEYLARLGVGMVVVDQAQSSKPLAHHRLLVQALREQPERWRAVAHHRPDQPGAPGLGVIVYRPVVPPVMAPSLDVDVEKMINRGRLLGGRKR